MRGPVTVREAVWRRGEQQFSRPEQLAITPRVIMIAMTPLPAEPRSGRGRHVPRFSRHDVHRSVHDADLRRRMGQRP
jgi:hypothetical protein